ncbi:MAG: tRNA(Ile)-lysidine synthase [Verrucomicrobiales bacterium]|jgi:tRNA(Ile)-lysidine synthase
MRISFSVWSGESGKIGIFSSHFAIPKRVKNLTAQFPVSERYLLGISGGRDSTALLQLLAEAGYRDLVLCHLNHQLRAKESDLDAEFVCELARENGFEVEIGVENIRQRGGSIETAARAARHAFFRRCAEKFGTNRVFLAHHADDQIETVLMNMFRGAGAPGLAGMETVTEIEGLKLIRPLLETPQADLPIPPKFREDASNASAEFLRNRIRHDVIPAICSATGRDLKSVLRTAEILREEDAALAAMTQIQLQQLLDGDRLRAPELRELPIALQRRVIRAWLAQQSVVDLSFDNIENVRGLLAPDSRIAKINLAAGRHVRRREKRLFLE